MTAWTPDPERHRPEGMEMAERVASFPKQDESCLEAYRDGWIDALNWALTKDDEEILEVLEARESA